MLDATLKLISTDVTKWTMMLFPKQTNKLMYGTKMLAAADLV